MSPAASTVRVTPDAPSPFPSGATVEFTATYFAVANDARRSPTWAWEWDDEGVASADPSTLTTCEVKVDDHTDQRLTAIATFADGSSVRSDPVTVTVSARVPPPGGAGDAVETPPATPPETPAIWDGRFAVVAAIALALVMAALLYFTGVLSPRLRLDDKAYDELDGRGIVAVAVIGPVIVIGILVTLVGLWMVATEWRGRFAKAAAPAGEPKKKGMGEDAAKVIEAVGKLKGSALVLVCGVVILLGVAWMTSSSAGAPPAPTPSTTSSATSGATPGSTSGDTPGSTSGATPVTTPATPGATSAPTP